MQEKKEKLNWKIILPFGFILAGWSMLWAVYNNFVPVYLQAGNPVFDAAGSAVTFGFGLTAFAAGLIMSIDNFLGLVSGPIVGRWSDKIGKRMIFMKIAMPISIVAFMLIPFAVKMILPENSGILSKLMLPFGLLSLCILAVVFGSAFSTVPAYALRYQLIPSKIRSQATGYIELIGAFGSILAYGLSGLLYGISTFLPFLVFGLLFLGATFYFLRVVKEPQDWVPVTEASIESRGLKGVFNVFKGFNSKQKLNVWLVLAIGFLFNFAIAPIQTFGSSYVVNVLHLTEGTASSMGAIFFVGYLLGTVPMGYLPKWFKRRGTLRLGGLIGIAAAVVLLFVHNFTVLQAMVGIMGFGFAVPQIILYPMMSDIVPDEKSFGSLIGLQIFSFMLATTLSVPFWGKMIDIFKNYNMVWIAVIIPLVVMLVLSLVVTLGEAKTEGSAN
jgi:maltose/moltooligosaccharide transporter